MAACMTAKASNNEDAIPAADMRMSANATNSALCKTSMKEKE